MKINNFIFLIIVLNTSCTKDHQVARLEPDTSVAIDSTDSETLTDDDSNPQSSNPSTIKTEVLGLFGTVGINSQDILKPIGLLPSNINVNGSNISINSNGTILENFDLRGYTIFLNSDNTVIKNCLLGEKNAPREGKRVIDIKANVKNFLIEYNDFRGYQGLGAGVSSGIFQRSLTTTEEGIGGIIRRNRFKHLGQDCVKTSGGVLVEENVFYATSNVADLPSGVWNSTTAYSLNEVVKATDSQKHYISLIANNLNNTPPSGNASNSNWLFYDPHYDIVNPFENTIPSVIRRNLFIINTRDPLIPEADKSYAVGLVNALRLLRNNSATPTNYTHLLVEENLIIGSAFYGIGFPIQAANNGNLWVNPTFINNLIDANINGKYAHPSTKDAVNWQENFDATLLSPINL